MAFMKEGVVLAGSPKHLAMCQELGKSKRDFLLINISGTCNYNCRKCCNLVPNKRVALSLDEIKGLISDAKEFLGIRTVAFMGEGETMLAPNFTEIIKHINSEKLYTIIFTNGYFVDKKMAEFLAKNNVSVVFSVDSLKKEFYEMLTGTRGTFDKMMNNIDNCRRVYSEKIRYEKGIKVLNLAINMLLMKDNTAEIDSLIKFCGKDVLPIFNYPMLTGNASNNPQLFGTLRKSEIEKLKKLAFESSPNKGPTNICPQQDACGYFFYGISLGCDGSLLPCPYALECTNLLGNIKNTSLEKALELQKKAIGEFRKLDKKGYCLLRSGKYKQFISKYRNKVAKVQAG